MVIRYQSTRTRERPDEFDWSLLSAHGRVLFYIAICPHCSVEEIAGALDLTERSVRGVIRELRLKGMVHVIRSGRRHRYRVNLDAPLPAVHSRQAAEVTRRVMMWAAQQDLPENVVDSAPLYR